MDLKKIAGYEILEKLPYQGSAVLYKAKSPEGKTVLFKIIPPDVARDREFEKRFTREMQVVKALDHPNIVRAMAYGLDITSQTYYLATEINEGQTLQDRLDAEKSIPQGEALRLVSEVAKGLQHALEKGVVHRDIKPETIRLLPDGGVKISGFGLAKFSKGASLTEAGTVLGSPLYLSPEQARADGKVDIRSDIYSLGITLYHMLAGNPPFQDKIAMKVIKAHMDESLPPFPEGMEVPINVLELLTKMTSKNPNNRFSSPAEICQSIEKIQEAS